MVNCKRCRFVTVNLYSFILKDSNNQLQINYEGIHANNMELEEEIEELKKKIDETDKIQKAAKSRIKELESKILKKKRRHEYDSGYQIYIVQAEPYIQENKPIYKKVIDYIQSYLIEFE